MRSNHSPLFIRSFLSIICIAAQCPSAWAQPPQVTAPSVGPADTAQGSSPSIELRDVRLQNAGRMTVRVVNSTGQPEADQVVRILYHNAVIAETRSNAAGQVEVSGLRPGVHVVAVGDALVACRLWTAETAPPAAIDSPALVLSDVSLRGQYGYGYGPGPMMAPGLLAVGVTAAAVAAVLIGKNRGDGSVIVPSSP
ncbi:MAG: hypothetical protein R3C59_12295 [Planctomycetaceae bacterium]